MCVITCMLFPSFSMDEEKKEKRRQYKRRWISTFRALKRPLKLSNFSTSSSEDNEHELPLHTPAFNENEASCSGTSIVSRPGSYDDNDVADNNERILNIHHVENTHGDEWDWDMIDAHDAANESDDDEELLSSTLACDLSDWATQNHIKHNAVDKLLKVLIKHGNSNLPVTARTLLNTRREIETKSVSGMEYYYFGLEGELKNNLSKYPCELVNQLNVLDISLNIDGLPLFKSSKTSLWPVLCSIDLKPKTVFAVALTLGSSKPDSLSFLNEMIQDLNRILQNGITLQERLISVNLKCVICDAPAKAMVKGIKLYSGYCGCDRCNQKGEWIGRMTYQDIDNLHNRTDITFRCQVQAEHHLKMSPFCNLPIDMIKTFPIDYMHQVCLGVMKRLLLVWMRGKKKGTKMSSQNVEDISSRLIQLSPYIPKIFARKPRSLREIDYWKATEYRQFLLYTGKIVLKGILKNDLYNHFMTLSVAIAILVSPSLVRNHIDYARRLLTYFVHQSKILYGEEFLVYNVHSLLHIADDAEEFGSLDHCAAFAFENHMQHLKKMVRSGKNPLTQIVKRICELDAIQNKAMKTCTTQVTKKLSNKRPNNAYLLDNYDCCEIVGEQEETNHTGELVILCRFYPRGEAIYNMPCDSRITGGIKFLKRNSRMKRTPVHSLVHRAILIDSTDLHVTFLAVLHDFEW